MELIQDKFNQGSQDFAIKVDFVWGISGIDRSGNSMWDPEDMGSVIWDEEMDVSPPANQEALL